MIGRLEEAIENRWLLFMAIATAPSGSFGEKKNCFSFRGIRAGDGLPVEHI